MDFILQLLWAFLSLAFTVYFGGKLEIMEKQKKQGVRVHRDNYYGTVILFSLPLASLVTSLLEWQNRLFNLDDLPTWISWIIPGLLAGVLLRIGMYVASKLHHSPNTTS